VFGDLVARVLLTVTDPADLVDASASSDRPLAFDLRAHDRLLPLAVTLVLIEVSENVFSSAVDFDALSDHGSPDATTGQTFPDQRSLDRSVGAELPLSHLLA
jgi:hypothetical protein